MSWLEKFNWKPLTPGSLPGGARISAGKSGKVEMSLPTTAEVFVNCVPVNCIPSPESPAKRIVTVSSSSKSFSIGSEGVSMTVLISSPFRFWILAAFLRVHHLGGNRRQVHSLFRIALGQVRDHVKERDRANETVVLNQRDVAIALLVHDDDRLADGRLRRQHLDPGSHPIADGRFKVNPLADDLVQKIALGENANDALALTDDDATALILLPLLDGFGERRVGLDTEIVLRFKHTDARIAHAPGPIGLIVGRQDVRLLLSC